MKLYYHPVSTTSRPVQLAAAEMGIELDLQVVDLMKGEHHSPEYVKINPNRLVPVLEDGDFRMTESSAIIKYLADKANSPLYPKDVQKRARVNERMDWFNTNFYREVGYNLAYPQVYPHHKRATDEINQGVIKWGQEKAHAALQILNDHILTDDYVCGKEMTIADIFGAQLTSVTELLGEDLKKYPKVKAWLDRMKARPNWKSINAVHDDFAASLKGKPFITASA